MKNQWYYLNENAETIGPVFSDQIVALAETNPDIMIWQDGMPEWMPYSRCNHFALHKAKIESVAWKGPLGSLAGLLACLSFVLFVWGMKTDFSNFSEVQDGWWTWKLSWSAIAFIATCFTLSINSGEKCRAGKEIIYVIGLTVITTILLPVIGFFLIWLYKLLAWW